MRKLEQLRQTRVEMVYENGRDKSMAMSTSMNIAYATDDLYSRLVLVSLKSLFMNNTAVKKINVYIIEDHISESNKQLLMELAAEYRRKLSFLPLSEEHGAIYASVNGQKRTSPVVYSYCFLQDILPQEVDRVLLLEGDEMILGNLEPLYQTDLTGCYFAAVDDFQSKWFKKKLQLQADSPYVNAGVILFNLEEMRMRAVSEKMAEIIAKDDSEFFYEAQDELNILGEGKVRILPTKYNATTSIFLFDKYKDMLRYRKPSTVCAEKEFLEAKAHPVIVHFTKNQVIQSRPWTEGCHHPYKETYLAIRNQTVCAQDALWPAKRKKVSKILETLYMKNAKGFIAAVLGPVHAVLFPMFLYRFL